MQSDNILEILKILFSHFLRKKGKTALNPCMFVMFAECLSSLDCHMILSNQKFDTQIFFVLWISGVSAQSFIHAFTLTHSVFNVQIATPQVRKMQSCIQLRALISIILGHSFNICTPAPIDRGTLNFTPCPLLLSTIDTVPASEFLQDRYQNH